MKTNIKRTALAAAIAASLSGCATLTEDPQQQVTVIHNQETRDMDLSCTATNDRGYWKFRMEEPFYVRREQDPLTIKCEDNDSDYSCAMSVPSAATGKALGNILLGGIVGGIIDTAKDMDREYPKTIVLSCGDKYINKQTTALLPKDTSLYLLMNNMQAAYDTMVLKCPIYAEKTWNYYFKSPKGVKLQITDVLVNRHKYVYRLTDEETANWQRHTLYFIGATEDDRCNEEKQ